jgi:maltose O-acetyltransferase
MKKTISQFIIIIRKAGRKLAWWFWDQFYKDVYHIHPTEGVGGEHLAGRSVTIGAYIYIRGGELCIGDYTIKIGERCAIDANETIRARTQDRSRPVPGMHGEPNKRIGSNIVIGIRVWIGNNVGIRECVTLGSNILVGANSAITISFDGHSVIAGVPARPLLG